MTKIGKESSLKSFEQVRNVNQEIYIGVYLCQEEAR